MLQNDAGHETTGVLVLGIYLNDIDFTGYQCSDGTEAILAQGRGYTEGRLRVPVPKHFFATSSANKRDSCVAQ